ncbi:MAG TPA: response regulator [Geobacteraceae bacterium]|nr:response regulator [Geobacteraceae bacterium]
MLIVCPGCKTKFSFDEKKVGADGIKLRCSKCIAIFRVVRKSPEPVVAPPSGGPSHTLLPRIKVVVANESTAFCKAVTKVLANESFDVYAYNDGREAFNAILQLKPDVILLDVALPSMYGFEICDAIRKNPEIASVKAILIASIYDKTRYKRAPLSLYGADDYIEKHHIPDSLTAMIYRLVSGQKQVEQPPDARPTVEEEAQAASQQLSSSEMNAQEITRQELKRDEESVTSLPMVPSVPEFPEAHTKARRLARIIVSDIALYNQAKVEEGIMNGTFHELLADDITEGRALYIRRVSEEIRKNSSYLEDGFAELRAKKKMELGL